MDSVLQLVIHLKRSSVCGSALVREGLFDIVKDILKDAEESVRLSGYLFLISVSWLCCFLMIRL